MEDTHPENASTLIVDATLLCIAVILDNKQCFLIQQTTDKTDNIDSVPSNQKLWHSLNSGIFHDDIGMQSALIAYLITINTVFESDVMFQTS